MGMRQLSSVRGKGMVLQVTATFWQANGQPGETDWRL